MSSSRSSRSKKSEVSARVKRSLKETNGTDSDMEEIEINESDGCDSVASSDKPRKSESSFNRAAFSMPDDIKKLMERVTCCSCGKQLNPMNHGAVRKHPWLKVVTCKKCYKFLRSGAFTRDSDGIDEQCRWCGDGGRLYGCDFCHNCFCRTCIKRNLGRAEASHMEDEDDHKWHCYMCKPKKVRKLVQDCEKILGYIEKQDKKEKEKEDRAKQREKDKLKARRHQGKDKKEETVKKEEKDHNDEKSTPKRGFPAPKDKSLIVENLKPEKKEMGASNTPSSPDLIVVGDSPAKDGLSHHHRAIVYKPDARSGIQQVQKTTNGVMEVTVGPKNDKPVIRPYVKPIIMPYVKNTGPMGQGHSMMPGMNQRPMLAGMLTKTAVTSVVVDRGNLKKLAPLNDINALKNNIFPYNVDDIINKMSTVTQSLNLTVNSVKTDLAIAKLSQANMYQAKQTACTTMKNGMDHFFNTIRELLNVQIVANNPQINVPDDQSSGDTKPLSSSSLTSTLAKPGSLINPVSGTLDESAIPIEIDEPTPVKPDKVDADDDIVIVTDSDSKDDKVIVTNNDSKDVQILHINDDKIVKEEKINCLSEDEEETSEAVDLNTDNNNIHAIGDSDDNVDEIVLDDDDESESETNSKQMNEEMSIEEDIVKQKTSEKVCESSENTSVNEKSTSEDTKICDVDEANGINDNEPETEIEAGSSESDNTAAELELLKEMADELNEQEDKSREVNEPRRSGRNRKSETPDIRSDSDKESPVSRSSRLRQKTADDDGENMPDKKKGDEGELKKTDKKDSKNDNNEGRKGRKSVKAKDESESGEDSSDITGGNKLDNKERKSSKSLNKSGGKSNIECDSGSDMTEDEVPSIKSKKKYEERTRNSSKKNEKSEEKARDSSKRFAKSDQTSKKHLQSDEETDQEVLDKKKGKEKSSSKSQKKSDNISKNLESDEETDQESSERKKEKKTIVSKGQKKSEDLESDEESDQGIPDKKPRGKENSKSGKKLTEKSENPESNGESDQDIPNKKDKNMQKGKEKKISKSPKKSDKSDKALESDEETDQELSEKKKEKEKKCSKLAKKSIEKSENIESDEESDQDMPDTTDQKQSKEKGKEHNISKTSKTSDKSSKDLESDEETDQELSQKKKEVKKSSKNAKKSTEKSDEPVSDEESDQDMPSQKGKMKSKGKEQRGSKSTKKSTEKSDEPESGEESDQDMPSQKDKMKSKGKEQRGSKSAKKSTEKSDEPESGEESDQDMPSQKGKMKSKGKEQRGSKSAKKSTEKSDEPESGEESDQDRPSKTNKKKSKGKEQIDSKSAKKSNDKSKKTEETSNDDMKVVDDISDSGTSESSDESVQEFGKKRKKRKVAAKEEPPRRRTRQSEKKSDNDTENCDSDPEFDSDLEKEIKSLSKNTRLTRKKTKEGHESSKKEPKEKQEKTKVKVEKKGKKSVKVDDSDLSSGIELLSEEDNDSEDDTDNLSASQLKKLKQAGKAAMEQESDDEDMPDDLSDDSSDPEVSFPKLATPKKGKKHAVDNSSEDSDFITPKKKKRVRNKLLNAKISDSDSDVGMKKKGKKGKRGKKRKRKVDSDAFSDISDEEDNRNKHKGKGKKRRRIKKLASSDEENEKEPGEDDDVGSDEDLDDDDTPGGFLKRRKIRKVIGSKKLTDRTKAAQKAEEARRSRIDDRQKEYNTYVEVEGAEEEVDEVPEGTEREATTPVKTDSIATILGTPKKVPVTTKCVLELDKEKKKALIEIDRTLVKKLKPHQVEAVRFIYNCCVENVERLKKGEGSGCILAHCMGLGKTLSVITFLHTMLSHVKLTKLTKCLVVCPLNTCLNWVNEFEIWLTDVDFEIEVYEMSKVKQNYERAEMLKEWHQGGAGVMIMGYDMYRNLSMGSHCKNKKLKKIFYETLADPGPDIVVCDEGHILKNDTTSLSKSMSKIKSPRRVVLTGTPLQNNLGEYHCMVSFVKPSLLGTRKEFNNRFCNPITNGQCRDSTQFDVKLMKRRAHILHELLAGCVQRKDYSALTKFLPPKFEYVISVRLAKVQMTLYEKYLDMNIKMGDPEEMKVKGGRLFADYQALMRIWTHPWVLKLDEIRQENKRPWDDEDDDSFIDDSGNDEDSFVDDSSSSKSSDDEGSNVDSKRKKRRSKRGKGGSSSDEGSSKQDNPDEVVKKWTSKRRGNEEGAGSSWMDNLGYAQGPKEVTSEWWAEYVKEEDEGKLELSGKLTLLFEILKMCEDIGDKVLVFSQSLLSLDIIEDFLAKIDDAHDAVGAASDKDKPSTSDNTDKPSTSGDTDKPSTSGDTDKPSETSESSDKAGTSSETSKENGQETNEKSEPEKNKERLAQYGKSWSKGLDYFRMDGSTSSIHRKSCQDMFNDGDNYRARLFLISTKAGSLGINLVAANRVIIFDASWNPSHDIQSIFRVYRFGQVKPVYVYRFLAQGTMEEKIYERQVTKQSLSQRVVDEHQIERHFTSTDLQELYKFQPDRLDDPEKTARPLPMLPKDHMLAELMTHNKEWIVTYHEHDSLLENVVEQELNEEEKKAAWEDYEDEKKGINKAFGGMQMNPAVYATQQMNMQNLLLQGQANLGQAAVLQIVQDLKARFPNLPPEVFQQRVQAVLRQVLTQQIMQHSDIQRRQIEQQRINELNRLNQIKQQIQRQQAMINSQQRVYSMPGLQLPQQSILPAGLRPQTINQLNIRHNPPHQYKK